MSLDCWGSTFPDQQVLEILTVTLVCVFGPFLYTKTIEEIAQFPMAYSTTVKRCTPTPAICIDYWNVPAHYFHNDFLPLTCDMCILAILINQNIYCMICMSCKDICLELRAGTFPGAIQDI